MTNNPLILGIVAALALAGARANAATSGTGHVSVPADDTVRLRTVDSCTVGFGTALNCTDGSGAANFANVMTVVDATNSSAAGPGNGSRHLTKVTRQTTATLINEDFNNVPLATNVTGGAAVGDFFSSVSPGSINVVSTGFCAPPPADASGRCVQLGAANPNGGRLQSIAVDLQAGDTYTLSFDLLGRSGGGGQRNGTVSLAGTSFSRDLAISPPNGTHEVFSDITGNTTTHLTFVQVSGNAGLVLDNILLTCSGPTCSPTTEAPEPATLGLLVLGLLGAGFSGCKRRN